MRPVKSEPQPRPPAPPVFRLRRGRSAAVDEQTNAVEQRKVKRRRVNANADLVEPDDLPESTRMSYDETLQRRELRSRYLALKGKIKEEKEEIVSVDSNRFHEVMNEVEDLHKLVQKPREQVVDAETLLDIANIVESSVKSHAGEGVTPSEFVTALIKNFGQPTRGVGAAEDEPVSIKWKDIGLAVSPIFMKVYGFSSMLGPMNAELKARRIPIQRNRTRQAAETARPEELQGGQEEKSDTDKNLLVMFDILRRKKRVRLESLILNRISFAQTVENLFALSFLVKDGRAEIIVDENHSHFVSPKNAPGATSVLSGEVSYNHFVFKFDFKDWKSMINAVPEGEELMPHRGQSCAPGSSQTVAATNDSEDAPPSSEGVPATNDSEAGLATTPIRKLTRNRGRVVHNDSVVEDTPEVDNGGATRANAIRKCKRKLH